jgi:hypothetical protein
MPGLEPKGNFLAERRAVIVETFASLEAHARDFWRDDVADNIDRGTELFADEDGYVLCPYCATPLTVSVEMQRLEQMRVDPDARREVACGTCGLDVAADAASSVPKHLAGATHRCMHCSEYIRKRAQYCHHCATWQEPLEGRVEARDYYALAGEIIDELTKEGLTAEAKALRNIIDEGSTGTEILMGMRWQLKQIESAGKASAQTARRIRELVSQLDEVVR